jgi:hypothetical protein
MAIRSLKRIFTTYTGSVKRLKGRGKSNSGKKMPDKTCTRMMSGLVRGLRSGSGHSLLRMTRLNMTSFYATAIINSSINTHPLLRVREQLPHRMKKRAMSSEAHLLHSHTSRMSSQIRPKSSPLKERTQMVHIMDSSTIQSSSPFSPAPHSVDESSNTTTMRF